MEDKFTLRDFLVYFATGLFFLLVLLRTFDNTLLKFFNIEKSDIKDNEALVIFLLLPGLYLIGHFIHGLDLVLFKLGRYFWDLKSSYSTKLKKFKVLWIVNFLVLILNGYRVTGMLNKKGIIPNEFWVKVSRLQYDGKFEKAEYWNLMNDLFKGLTLVSFCWLLFVLYHFRWFDFWLSLLFTFVFWNRARHMVVNFVSTTMNTHKAITPNGG
ncbi:MAG: hypothetical protein JST70_12340 [Bacteroidetes bacterium]|nr:hypothetical protein [Bacteroidota bacterium]